MLPEYGVDWSKAMFEADGDAQEAIPAAIVSAVSAWIPEVTVNKVDVQYDYASGVESATVSLILPDNTVASLPLNTAYIQLDGTIN
jgi:phage baseplate assembly protein W